MPADIIECDVAIAGGGMVGATLACILARGGVNVGVFESRKPALEWEKGTVDLRVSALALSSQNIFETLGVWKGIAERGISAYREMRVWDCGGSGALHFDGADSGVDIMGHIVENRATLAALWESMAQSSVVSVVCPAKIVNLQPLDSHIVVNLDDGRTVKAQLLVGADGKSSTIRKLAGINVTGWSYQQDGLVTTISTSKPHRQTAYQWFLPTGPLAFLPLLNGDSSIVWSADTEITKKNLELSDDAFKLALEKASGGLLGNIEATAKRVSFPLGLQYANRYTAERVALIGDAAHSVHPLAGQGVNMGLLDAAALGELIITAREQRRPISSPNVLRRYERWRKGDNLVMLATMDALKRTYSVSFGPFNQVRTLGMNIIDNTLLLKNCLNRYAMGLRDNLPKLASGLPCWR